MADMARKLEMKLTNLLLTEIAFGAIEQHHPWVVTSPTTTWNLTKSFISLCGPLEDVNGGIRLHIIVRGIITKR